MRVATARATARSAPSTASCDVGARSQGERPGPRARDRPQTTAPPWWLAWPYRVRGSSTELDSPAIAAGVREPDAVSDLGQRRQRRLRPLGPLDERDRLRPDVVLEQVGILVAQVGHAIEVNMGDRHWPRVAL